MKSHDYTPEEIPLVLRSAISYPIQQYRDRIQTAFCWIFGIIFLYGGFAASLNWTEGTMPSLHESLAYNDLVGLVVSIFMFFFGGYVGLFLARLLMRGLPDGEEVADQYDAKMRELGMG